MRSLLGSHCIITGASRGIGHAIGHAFAQKGANLTLIGRNETTLQSCIKSLRAISDKRHSEWTGDVSSASFWSQLAKDTELPQQNVDVLVNAAGVTHASLLMRTTESSIEEIVQTNLMGTMWACRAMSKRMLRNKVHSSRELGMDQASVAGRSIDEHRQTDQKGCIINVASLFGYARRAGSAAYAASKAGIVGLTRALAAELGPSRIRVNAILPGYVETDMTAAMTPEAREVALSRIPVKRFGTPDEIANAAVFLALNAYANNCVLNLDGGLSATVSSVM